MAASPTHDEHDDSVPALLTILVTQTLDDLDESRFDLESALHALASAAYDAGRRNLCPRSGE